LWPFFKARRQSRGSVSPLKLCRERPSWLILVSKHEVEFFSNEVLPRGLVFQFPFPARQD
jgi:hypothetical protein